MLWRNTVNYLFQSSELVGDMTSLSESDAGDAFCKNLTERKRNPDQPYAARRRPVKMRNAVVNTMSGGEQQRVALAGTLLKPGKLILPMNDWCVGRKVSRSGYSYCCARLSMCSIRKL